MLWSFFRQVKQRPKSTLQAKGRKAKLQAIMLNPHLKTGVEILHGQYVKILRFGES